MKHILRLTIAIFAFIGPSTYFAQVPRAASNPAPTIETFLAPGYPTELVSAKRADRIAWTAYEHGLRNVFTAAAPDFKPVRLTNFLKDDGV